MLSLDIETDTSPLTLAEVAAGFTTRGLDPRITAVTEVAVYDGQDTHVFEGAEKPLLSSVFEFLRYAAPGRVVTWNGAVFDFPFLDSRGARHGLLRPFTLRLDATIKPKYDPTPGYEGGYRVGLLALEHVDLAYLAQPDARARGVSWSLKPYARACGLDPIEVDRSRMHVLTPAQRREYVASDAITTWRLAHRYLNRGRDGYTWLTHHAA